MPGISNTKDSVKPSTEKRDENLTRSGVFLTKFVVFGNMIKRLLGVFDMSSLWKLKIKSKMINKMLKIEDQVSKHTTRISLVLTWGNIELD